MEPDATGPAWAFDIAFAGRDPARAVLAGPRRPVTALLGELGLSGSRPVLLLIGGAASLDATVQAQLTRLFERGAIRAAADAGATLLDGGTDSGVMQALGQAAGQSDVGTVLVGVSPVGLVTWPGDDRAAPGDTQLEPNHTQFLLANSAAWGGETSLLFDTFDELRRGRVAAVVLAGGGDVALDEARLVAHRGLPIIAIGGTGGTADELAERLAARPARPPRDVLTQILAESDVTVLPLNADPIDLERALGRLLGVDETLAEAWRQQHRISAVASRQQHEFRVGQAGLLLLGLLLTFLVISKASLEAAGLGSTDPQLQDALTFLIILLPITITTISAASIRFRPGNRWILLRGTSESLKREIFRYRARAGIYSHEQTKKVSRQVKLAEAIGSAMGALMRTDVNALALGEGAERPGAWQRFRLWLRSKVAVGQQEEVTEDPLDDPLSPLTPDAYVRFRIDPQIAFYQQNVTRLERQGRFLRWLAWIFGGLGTLLAAIGFQIWVAVTTAIVGVFATLLEAYQLETTVALYNQAASDLGAIRAWWNALPATDQDLQANIDRLVERSERIMRAEHSGWVQEMQDAMTQLRLEQATSAQGEPAGGGDGARQDGPRRSAPKGDDQKDPDDPDDDGA